MTENKTGLKDISSSTSEDTNDATITISAKAPYRFLAQHYGQSFNNLIKNLKLDGFRKGKIPPEVAKSKIPEILVLEKAAQTVISDLYLPLLQKHQVDGLGEPQIQITKLAKDNPLEFTITLAKIPQVDLKEYQRIRDQIDDTTINPDVTKQELDQAIEGLRHQWAQQEKYQKLMAEDPEQAGKTDPRQIKVDDQDLPQVDDKFVKGLGDYKSTADFRDKFRENIKLNKAKQELDRRRSEALSKIIDQAEYTVPELVYEAELDRMFELRQAEIKQAGLKFGDYLKAVNKSSAELRADMKVEAKNRVHSQMVIAKIAKLEDLKPDNDLVDQEVEHLAKLYPDAPQPNLVAYVQSQLTSGEVLKWLVAPTDDKNDTKK
jgi:trigger factor